MKYPQRAHTGTGRRYRKPSRFKATMQTTALPLSEKVQIYALPAQERGVLPVKTTNGSLECLRSPKKD